MENNILYSIIVVCLNAKDTIGKTIDSILSQTCSDYEVIVKDGGSSDGTLSFIPVDSRIVVIEKKDTGIYDAMNQAIDASKGQYLIFMNCGDTFAHSDVLYVVKQKIDKNMPAMIYGNYIRDGIVHEQPGVLTPFYLYRTPLCHQTIFFNGELLRTEYRYNTGYRILGDYDLELRLLFANLGAKHVSIEVCEYLGGGVSETPVGRLKGKAERKAILPQYYTTGQSILYEVLLSLTLRKLRRWISSGYGPVWIKKAYQALVNRINRLS